MRFILPLLMLSAVACSGSETETPAPAEKPAAEKPAPAEKPAEPAAKAEAPAEEVASNEHPGKATYEQYCVTCHGEDGKGNNGLGGDYAKVLVDRDDADLVKSIKEGKTGEIGTMPPWGQVLNDEQVNDVLAYVKETYGPKAE